MVDDDASLRRSLSRLLRSSGWKSEAFASAPDFLDRPPHDGPACLILDLHLPGLSGLELQRSLVEQEAQIIFLTGHGDVATCADAMKVGAVDFFTKPVDDAELLDAVERAVGRSISTRRVVQARAVARKRVARLTPRELQVLQGVIAGSLNKQIAAHLGASEKTIKIHRARVMSKLGAESVVDLVRLAETAGVAPISAMPAP